MECNAQREMDIHLETKKRTKVNYKQWCYEKKMQLEYGGGADLIWGPQKVA